MTSEWKGSRSSALVAGIVLIAAGAVFLAGELGIANLHHLVRGWWPLIPVAIGVPMLFDRDRRGGGLTMIAIGAWMLISNMGLFGLAWWSSWPLLLILIGSAMILNAIADAVVPRREPREGGGAHAREE